MHYFASESGEKYPQKYHQNPADFHAKAPKNSSKAYVSVSRGAHDAQLFTNSIEKLPAALGHDVFHESAHAPEIKQEQAIVPQREIAPKQEQSLDIGLSL